MWDFVRLMGLPGVFDERSEKMLERSGNVRVPGQVGLRWFGPGCGFEGEESGVLKDGRVKSSLTEWGGGVAGWPGVGWLEVEGG